METVWFVIVAVMLAGYVLLDGFDLGAGVIHLFAARTDQERREILASIGPVWDGNEVWLLAAGGTLYFAFPALYSAGFSGFYLALMVVLWLLILRGISIEFRNHLTGLWRPFWDVVFSGSSTLLAIFYGAALGNVVRGVPLDKEGFFFLPFWTNFQPYGATPGIIDWYTLLIGVTALLTLTLHGSLWVVMKTSNDLQRRSRAIAARTFWAVCAGVLVISVASFKVQPHLLESFTDHSWTWAFPLLATLGLFALKICQNSKLDLGAFLGSGVFITGLLCSAAFGLYPNVLPSVPTMETSLTIYNAAAPGYGLSVGFVWWVPAFLLAVGYSTFVYRHFRGKVSVVPAHDVASGTPVNMAAGD